MAADSRDAMSPAELSRAMGEMIRSSRLAAGLTQGDLGDRAGIVGKYVSEIERGTRDVPLSTLLAIVERGLRLQLDIAFRRRGAQVGKVPLPEGVAQIAEMIAALPMEMRVRMVALVRDIVDLVNRRGGT